jgi:transcriptional regulator with XRE-family HTH domain
VNETLGGTLASRLRQERKRRGLSLRALAAAAGLSTTTVHQIESGKGSPSLATLQAIASVLDVPLGVLFEAGTQDGAVVVVQRGQRTPASSVPGGTLQSLAAGLPGQRLRGIVLTLGPSGETGEAPMTHAGQELVTVLSGRCLYEVAGAEHLLAAGDSLALDSRQPHRARNPGRRPCRLLIVLYAPEDHPVPDPHQPGRGRRAR